MPRALRDWTHLQHSIKDEAAQLLNMISPRPLDGGSVGGFDPENPSLGTSRAALPGRWRGCGSA
eukprot:2558906-Pyramimonas_sp.AAC.1